MMNVFDWSEQPFGDHQLLAAPCSTMRPTICREYDYIICPSWMPAY